MTSTAELLADRYGRRTKPTAPKRHLWLWVCAAAAVTVFVVWAITAVNTTQNPVSLTSSVAKPFGKQGFVVSGQVTRPVGGVVRCALTVQALDFSVVGYREITLDPGVTSFDAKVFSVAPGVSASVTGCWLQ